MVWEVKNLPLPSSHSKDYNIQQADHQAEHTGTMSADEDQVCDPLCYDEHFLSSCPSLPTSDSFMEYDDLPDLQEVQEELTPATVYQVELGMSHQERHADPQPPPETLWLTQLAHIATGPQSPLLQDLPHSGSSAVCIPSASSHLHTYALPPPALLSSTLPSRVPAGSDIAAGECGSALSTRSSLSDDEDMGWSFSCPTTAWHCFLKGTCLHFHCGSHVEWQDVEDLGSGEEDCGNKERSRFLKSYGSEGLQLVEHEETVSSGQAVLQLTFDPGVFGHTPITARCQLDHPFYVKNKGWSSFYPSLTVVHYGIPCYEMEVGDTCLPPGHRDTKHTDDSLVFDTFKSYDFTPLDSSAVYLLSNMARRRRASQSSGGAVSPTEMHYQSNQRPPWRAVEENAKRGARVFTLQAKALADEQKRLNPDCWKRKRTNSGCQGNQS